MNNRRHGLQSGAHHTADPDGLYSRDLPLPNNAGRGVGEVLAGRGRRDKGVRLGQLVGFVVYTVQLLARGLENGDDDVLGGMENGMKFMC